jgi:hypothetical protein
VTAFDVSENGLIAGDNVLHDQAMELTVGVVVEAVGTADDERGEVVEAAGQS